MKSKSLFGVLGVSFAGLAAMAAFGGCSSSTTNAPGDDGGNSSSSSGGSTDDSSTSDAPTADGSSSSSSSSGGSSSGSSDANADAPACTATTTFDPPDCDTCMKAMCCTTLVTCETADDAGVDDAGNSACYDALLCSLSFAADDGGTLDDAITSCTGGTTSGTSTALTALLTCATTSCAAQCQ